MTPDTGQVTSVQLQLTFLIPLDRAQLTQGAYYEGNKLNYFNQ